MNGLLVHRRVVMGTLSSFLYPDPHDGVRRCSSVEAGKHSPGGEIEFVNVGGLIVCRPERAVADQVQPSPEAGLGHLVRLDESAGRAQARNHLTARDEDAPIRKHAEVLCRSEEHTSELQSLAYLVCRLLLEKKKHH